MLLLGAEAPLWFGRPPAVALLRVLDALDSPWNVAHYAVMAPVYGVLGSLSTLLILYLLHAVFKRLWVAQTLVFLFGIIGAMGDVSWARGVAVMVFGAFGIVFISRVGPLCTSVFLATILLSSRVPLTLDLSAW